MGIGSLGDYWYCSQTLPYSVLCSAAMQSGILVPLRSRAPAPEATGMVLLQALLEAGGWHVRAAVRGARLRMTVDAARPAGWSLAYLRLAVRVVLVWCRAKGSGGGGCVVARPHGRRVEMKDRDLPEAASTTRHGFADPLTRATLVVMLRNCGRGEA